MKIIIAPDKFKGSLTGMEFCKAVEEGVKEIIPDTEILWLPLADGGDGTIEVVNYYLKGQIVNVEVNNPFFEPTKASYLYSDISKTAFIEMAEASGIKLLKEEELDCKNATTLGTGEMIVDAIKKGATKIILGIGGSATNDCGIGMASALGYRFLDKNKNEVIPIGANLSRIDSIDKNHVLPELNTITFKVACDVTNPLYGNQGASCVYASQKGASEKDVVMLDKGLQDFSRILQETFQVDVQSVKGAGAAGGLGIASKVFLNGNLEPGIELMKNIAQFESKIENAEWIITGEGKLDRQTLSGKTIHGIITSAKARNIKVAALCGAIELDENSIETFGIDYLDAVLYHSENLEDAMLNGFRYVKDMARNFAEKI